MVGKVSSRLRSTKKTKVKNRNSVDFLYLVIHQLKKPLSVMRVSLQMLLRGDFGVISKEQEDIIRKMSGRNETLLCLVDDLMQMAKLEERGYTLRLTPVDILNIVESAVANQQDEIEKKKITLVWEELKIKSFPVMIDRERMSLALQNIIDNAVKYTPEGGTIKISFGVNPRKIKLRVQDSGIGIPETEKKKLFTKFFRGTNAVKMDTVGSGLGLFIAKTIIEGHGGKISFTSKENGGSTFYVELPMK